MILIIKNILGILTDPKNTRMFLLGGIGILLFLLVRQCNETEEAKGEVTRFQNNLSAANDTILNYVNENGESVGEIKGLNLSLEEFRIKEAKIAVNWLEKNSIEFDEKKIEGIQVNHQPFIVQEISLLKLKISQLEILK